MKKILILGKHFVFATVLCAGLSLTASCGDDDDDEIQKQGTTENENTNNTTDNTTESTDKEPTNNKVDEEGEPEIEKTEEEKAKFENQLREAELLLMQAEDQNSKEVVNLTFSDVYLSSDFLSIWQLIGLYPNVNVYLTLEPNENLKRIKANRLNSIDWQLRGDKIEVENEDGTKYETYPNQYANVVGVKIPEGVTSIGTSAFYNCGIKTIEFPSTLTKIDNNAFGNCSALESITIPETITEIAGDAFYSCSSLKSITFPTNVKINGNFSMYYCSALESITIPETVTEIAGDAFYSCSSLTSIAIPEGVTSIGNYAFQGCSSLTSITIPESVTSIGDQAFSGCSSLTSITIPESVTSIGESAFRFCSSLTSITIPEGVTSIGNNTFYDCSSLESVTIGVLNSSMFYGTSNLKNITILEGVTTIPWGAFSHCDNLESITIPTSVTEYPWGIFSSCSSLTSLTTGVLNSQMFYNSNAPLKEVKILDGITNIYTNALVNCTNLEKITFCGKPFLVDLPSENCQVFVENEEYQTLLNKLYYGEIEGDNQQISAEFTGYWTSFLYDIPDGAIYFSIEFEEVVSNVFLQTFSDGKYTRSWTDEDGEVHEYEYTITYYSDFDGVSKKSVTFYDLQNESNSIMSWATVTNAPSKMTQVKIGCRAESDYPTIKVLKAYVTFEDGTKQYVSVNKNAGWGVEITEL